MSEQQHNGFHAGGNLYFKRLNNGNVVVIVDGDHPQTFELHPSTWASAVASVSARGDTREAWQEALEFHDGLSTEEAG